MAPTEATPLVAVIGVGFVGTGLVDSFSSKYEIMGFDISEDRLEFLRGEFSARPNVSFTSNESDRPLICLISAAALRRVEQWARPGCTVVIESSVSVGLTRELLGPLLRPRVSSPECLPEYERSDPGRVEPPMRSIPKVVSGLDDVIPGSLDAVVRRYGRVFDSIVPVAKPEVAEMCKLYENCQRMMCIAYANEMADAARALALMPSRCLALLPLSPSVTCPTLPVSELVVTASLSTPTNLLSNCEFPLLEACADKMNRAPLPPRPRRSSMSFVEPAAPAP
ncbi:hypothetical protein ACKAV7_013302 [Fusarium commune]